MRLLGKQTRLQHRDLPGHVVDLVGHRFAFFLPVKIFGDGIHRFLQRIALRTSAWYSVTDRVMRTSPRPVLVVCKPPHESTAGADEPGQHVHHLSRILFCADFSENSERALKYAISLTLEYDAELTLLHVLEKVPRSAEAAETIAAATEQLEKLIPVEERKTLKIATAVRIGKAYEQIIQFALDSQIDLVVMGVRGRGGLDLAVFGSTTYRVMQLGPCPVLANHV